MSTRATKPIPRVTSQKVDITRSTLEAAYWRCLGCWSNNVANSHPKLWSIQQKGSLLRSCLVPQWSHPPHWPYHQRRLANCDWMPASYHSGQPSYLHRHPTCWALSQRSRTVSSTPCHGAWTSSPRSAHLSTESECTAYQIETPICIRRITHQFNWQHRKFGAILADHRWNAEWLDNTTGLRTFSPSSPTPANTLPGMALPRTAWVRLNRLRTGVGRFRSMLAQMGMVTSATCECGAEEQTVDHVVLHCPIQRTPRGLHRLTVLDDETIESLLNTCPKI